jgi:hypothetical protein
MSQSNEDQKGLEKALSALKHAREELEKGGLSRYSFFLGVLNLIVTTFIIAKVPEYFCLAYALKAVLLIPLWLRYVHSVYNGARFIFDYCWVKNCIFCLYMIASLMGLVPKKWQLYLFSVFYASALGPLAGAAVLLSNGLVFHSVEKTASTFIHTSPALVAWTMVVYSDQIQKTWPGCFPTMDEFNGVTSFELYTSGFVVYMMWLAIHGLWLLTWGIDCPACNKATVFDNIYKTHGLNKTYKQWTGWESLRSHAFLYLVFHALLVSISFFLPLLCRMDTYGVYIHTGIGVLIVVSIIWNASTFYEYWLSKKYIKVLEKELKQN